MKNSYQIIGCFTAFLFPFAANSILGITKIPIIVTLIYYILFGIYIRLSYEDRLPYFKPQINKVKIEICFFIIFTVASATLYIQGMHRTPVSPIAALIPVLVLYSFVNGTLEHLIWVNVYDLCGKNLKSVGVIATFIFVALIHVFFWNIFVPTPFSFSSIPMLIFQFITLFIAIRIYEKTRDITIWSIQHIIYDIIVVIFGGFSLEMYLKLLAK